MPLFRDLSFETAFLHIEQNLELLNDRRTYTQDAVQVQHDRQIPCCYRFSPLRC